MIALSRVLTEEKDVRSLTGVPLRFKKRSFTVLPVCGWDHYYQRPQALAVGLSQLLPGWDFFFVSTQQVQPFKRQAANLFIVNREWFYQHEHELSKGVFYSTFAKHANDLKRAAVSWFDLCDYPELYYPEAESDIRQITKWANVITACAPHLKRDFLPINRNRSIVWRNACWPANTALPPVEDQRSPVVGAWMFPGAWVDYELLSELGKRIPVFVAGAPSHKIAHTVNAGYISYEGLKSFASTCTHLIIPFSPNNPITWYADPMKFYEYVAARRVLIYPETMNLDPGVPHRAIRYSSNWKIESLTDEIQTIRGMVPEYYLDEASISWSARIKTLAERLF